MDKSSEVDKFCNGQEDPNVGRATFLEKVGQDKDVSQTVDDEEQNEMPNEKISLKMRTLKCEDEAIMQTELKEATSVHVRQSSIDAAKLESPLSPQLLDIVIQKINTHPEPESGQTSGKGELVVMPQLPRSKHERGLSLEENDLRRQFQSLLPDSSLRSRATNRSPHPVSTPVSPYHGKVGSKGGLPASPFWEKKVSSSGTQGFGSATPIRRQPRQITHTEASPDDSPTVPKFGDWDENNPSSADGFTQVFDQVREQRQNGGGTRTATMNGPSSHNRRGKFRNNSSEGCCCFPWGKR